MNPDKFRHKKKKVWPDGSDYFTKTNVGSILRKAEKLPKWFYTLIPRFTRK